MSASTNIDTAMNGWNAAANKAISDGYSLAVGWIVAIVIGSLVSLCCCCLLIFLCMKYVCW